MIFHFRISQTTQTDLGSQMMMNKKLQTFLKYLCIFLAIMSGSSVIAIAFNFALTLDNSISHIIDKVIIILGSLGIGAYVMFVIQKFLLRTIFPSTMPMIMFKSSPGNCGTVEESRPYLTPFRRSR
jgi:hypothetical protein